MLSNWQQRKEVINLSNEFLSVKYYSHCIVLLQANTVITKLSATICFDMYKNIKVSVKRNEVLVVYFNYMIAVGNVVC